MCDAQSMVAAYGQYQQGQANSDIAKSQGDFEAAQLRNMAFLAGAKGADDQAQLQKSYRDQMEDNIAAGIVSGIGLSSFESVMMGNRADMRENAGRIDGNTRRQQQSLRDQAEIAEVSGRLEAKAAAMNGIYRAADTMITAGQNYLDTRGPSGDADDNYVQAEAKSFKTHFMKSIRGANS